MDFLSRVEEAERRDNVGANPLADPTPKYTYSQLAATWGVDDVQSNVKVKVNDLDVRRAHVVHRAWREGELELEQKAEAACHTSVGGRDWRRRAAGGCSRRSQVLRRRCNRKGRKQWRLGKVSCANCSANNRKTRVVGPSSKSLEASPNIWKYRLSVS